MSSAGTAIADGLLYYPSEGGGHPTAACQAVIDLACSRTKGKDGVAWIAVRCSWTRAMCWRTVRWRCMARRRRESVSWDYAGLLQLFGNLAMERTRLPLLRCYWYEATVEGRRSADHDVLADLPGVKLRLTKMRPGRREGVEGEIHRDLTTLARNKAVSDVMVVSAEEDLAQVIADVQDMGMRVTLLQITTDGNWSSSRALRQECDDIVEVSAEHLRPYVDLISGAEPPRPDEPEAEPFALRPAVNGNGIGVNGAGHAPAHAAAAAWQAGRGPAEPSGGAAGGDGALRRPSRASRSARTSPRCRTTPSRTSAPAWTTGRRWTTVRPPSTRPSTIAATPPSAGRRPRTRGPGSCRRVRSCPGLRSGGADYSPVPDYATPAPTGRAAA